MISSQTCDTPNLPSSVLVLSPLSSSSSKRVYLSIKSSLAAVGDRKTEGCVNRPEDPATEEVEAVDCGCKDDEDNDVEGELSSVLSAVVMRRCRA